MRVAFLAAGAGLGMAVAGAGASWGQESPTDKLYACVGMADGQARLACYDAAAAALKKAQADGEVSVVSRAQVQQAGRDAFGLGLAAQADAMASVATSAAPPPELDVIEVTIASVQRRPDGTSRFTLDNGQVWEQTDTVNLGTLSKGPMKGEIRRGALGSFFLKAGNRTAVRAKRVR
jgi:hypothetical protein